MTPAYARARVCETPVRSQDVHVFSPIQRIDNFKFISLNLHSTCHPPRCTSVHLLAQWTLFTVLPMHRPVSAPLAFFPEPRSQ